MRKREARSIEMPNRHLAFVLILAVMVLNCTTKDVGRPTDLFPAMPWLVGRREGVTDIKG